MSPLTINDSEEDVRRLVEDGWHASHLCGNPLCFAEEHILVEPKAANERRKNCPGARPTIVAELGGRTLLVPPAPCTCPRRRCISMAERRPLAFFEDELGFDGEEGGEDTDTLIV